MDVAALSVPGHPGIRGARYSRMRRGTAESISPLSTRRSSSPPSDGVRRVRRSRRRPRGAHDRPRRRSGPPPSSPWRARSSRAPRVHRGDPVAALGAGGHAPPGTLHLGVRRDGRYINPRVLPRRRSACRAPALLRPRSGPTPTRGVGESVGRDKTLPRRGIESGSCRGRVAPASPGRCGDPLPRRAGASPRSAAAHEAPPRRPRRAGRGCARRGVDGAGAESPSTRARNSARPEPSAAASAVAPGRVLSLERLLRGEAVRDDAFLWSSYLPNTRRVRRSRSRSSMSRPQSSEDADSPSRRAPRERRGLVWCQGQRPAHPRRARPRDRGRPPRSRRVEEGGGPAWVATRRRLGSVATSSCSPRPGEQAPSRGHAARDRRARVAALCRGQRRRAAPRARRLSIASSGASVAARSARSAR